VSDASVVGLFKRFREQTMVIYSALLAEKRVIFLGHGLPARDVCNCVVSACLLVSPPLLGTLNRAFPYANLTQLEFLEVWRDCERKEPRAAAHHPAQVPGVVAGVTNPIFEQRQDWWDVLCNLQTGAVTRSPAYQRELSAGLEDGEAIPEDAYDQEMASKILSGLQLKQSEEWCRCQFRDYTQHVVAIALEEEVWRDHHAEAKEYEMLGRRIKRLRETQQFKQHRAYRERLAASSAFREAEPTVRRHVRHLQMRNTGDETMLDRFNELLKLVEKPAELLEFLALLPESQGGLFPLAINLFHTHPQVRFATVEMLQRLDRIEEGKGAVSSLNYFLLLTYHRLLRESQESARKQQQQQQQQQQQHPSPSFVVAPAPPRSLTVSVRRASSVSDEESSPSPRPRDTPNASGSSASSSAAGATGRATRRP
jgi:hypothetical protein